METGFLKLTGCYGLTSNGADYGEDNEQYKIKKIPLTWGSQHFHQDIHTVPRLEGKIKAQSLKVTNSQTHAYNESQKNSS